MMAVVFALLLGIVIGGLLMYRLFSAAATAGSRRALGQLQGTLDGLESAYSIKVATFEAQRELAQLSPLTLHLPPKPD